MGEELPGYTLITNPKSPPPGPNAKLIPGLPLQCLDSISMLLTTLPSSQSFSVFLGTGRHQGDGPKWTNLAPKGPDT